MKQGNLPHSSERKSEDSPTLEEINHHQKGTSSITEKRTEEKSVSVRPRYHGSSHNSYSAKSKIAYPLLGLTLGCILFFVSIQTICWIKRRAVKFYSFIEWVKDTNNCVYLGNTILDGDKPNEHKAYIVYGGLNCTQEANVTYSNFDPIANKMRKMVAKSYS